MTRRRLVGAATIALVFAATGHWMGGPPLSATNPPPPVQSTLQLFKNYFITGDHVVRGISLWRKGVNGTAVVDIPELGALGGPNGVPVAADIVAAFLYVQTSERTGFRGSGIDSAKFNGFDLGPFMAPGSNVRAPGRSQRRSTGSSRRPPAGASRYPASAGW